MKVFFNNIITFINGLDTFVKVLIIGVLLLIDILCIIQVVKTHVNPKKPVFKILQFIMTIIFILLTIFVCAHV
ncbi:MAG: hypothetical protein IJ318_01825 [Clostridia bacterium]|nr:hypothetical protein [Clostridia bacterium]